HLSRFGPLYNAERLGGAVTLAAMAVPEAEFDRVAEAVNAHPEVAHNYARDHALNMWFVISTDRPQHIDETIEAIEEETGLTVYEMPKLEEFTIGLRFEL
ncbi:MAG: Lrp/AsnC family transcriptional regulator, partial [Kiloniellales bacterium]